MPNFEAITIWLRNDCNAFPNNSSLPFDLSCVPYISVVSKKYTPYLRHRSIVPLFYTYRQAHRRHDSYPCSPDRRAISSIHSVLMFCIPYHLFHLFLRSVEKAFFFIERTHLFHFLVIQFEIEKWQYSPWYNRGSMLREWQRNLLEYASEELSGREIYYVPWLFIGWQTEQRTIRHRTTQQKPTSNVNTIRFYLVAYGQPLSVRVAFDLQYCGFYTRFDHNFLEHLVICIEITDSQCTYFSHITPCTHKIAGWLVNKSNCMCSNILSIASNVLLSPYSVGQSFEVIQIFSREIPLSFTARPTPASSLCMSSIDMSITDLQSSKARLFTYRTGWLHKSSQTELRHQHTIIELYHRYISDSFTNILCGNKDAAHQGHTH